jgi:RNA recognition motif-containing protein
MKKLYVGNIPWTATEDQLKQYFAPIGEVQSVNIIVDRETNRSRGFCFVEMENADEAIAQLNGKEFEGRVLKINEAQERKPNSGGPRGESRGGYGKGSYGKNSY